MKIIRWLLVGVLLLCLIMVRMLEDTLFYDPLLEFFHGDYLHSTFPDMDVMRHLMGVVFRYGLNALLSLGIIYLMFGELRIVKFIAWLMLIFLIPFLALYYYFIHIEFEGAFTAGFYVRRFLLQPILLLILIPSIWFYKNQKQMDVKEN